MSKTIKYRKQLGAYLQQPNLRIAELDALTLKRLDAAHVAILALDFDGVLAPHGQTIPSPDALTWLRKLAMDLGEQRIVIYSNKPMPERIRYFKKHFPGILVLEGSRKKTVP